MRRNRRLRRSNQDRTSPTLSAVTPYPANAAMASLTSVFTCQPFAPIDRTTERATMPAPVIATAMIPSVDATQPAVPARFRSRPTPTRHPVTGAAWAISTRAFAWASNGRPGAGPDRISCARATRRQIRRVPGRVRRREITCEETTTQMSPNIASTIASSPLSPSEVAVTAPRARAIRDMTPRPRNTRLTSRFAGRERLTRFRMSVRPVEASSSRHLR